MKYIEQIKVFERRTRKNVGFQVMIKCRYPVLCLPTSYCQGSQSILIAQLCFFVGANKIGGFNSG